MKTRNKVLIFVFAFALLLNFCDAIRINEVEMNPSEGKEWIELYNDDEEVNVSNWKIYDGLSSPKKIYTFLNETKIDAGGYYIVEFSNRLNNDNNGDFVTLYDNSHQKIDETEILKDTLQSSETHQFCSSSWKFMTSTKGQENDCIVEQVSEPQTTQNETAEEDNPTTQETSDDAQSVSSSAASTPKQAAKTITLNTISLNSKDIKSENNKQTLKKNLALAGIVSFCLGFGALFFLKKARRKKQNEFR